ncbi:MAG: hypothetical protein L0215_12565 [Gemmataceae bacterium]|nr:hypothetical protein [Gemmataceae bacterium]
MRLCGLTCAVLVFASAANPARADSFDHYYNNILTAAPASQNAEMIKQLSPEIMVQHSRVLPNITATLIVVKTNEGRFCKLLVQPARQKISDTESLPIVLIERYVTYREGEERTIQAKGENLRLFPDFRLNLDIGQIVPEALGGDLRLVAQKDNVFVEPIGKAEMYVVTKHFADANPKKSPKLVVGDKFEPRYFNGTYKIYDDGRRSGTIKLIVNNEGEVSGHYFSDKDGQKYDVSGKIGNPNHTIQFMITFPRTMQFFNGYLFTGDGRVLTGSSRLQERETGFYAVRQDVE